MELRERKVIPEKDVNQLGFKQDAFSKALYVLIFSKTADRDTVSWLLELMCRSQQDGGAELLVEVTIQETMDVVVEISASPLRFLEAAEAMEIMKIDKNGNLKEFIFSSLDLYLTPGVDMNNLLTTAEKQRIILEELMNLRSREKKKLIGYPHVQLYPGQSLIQVCKDNGIIKQLSPLHELTELEALKKKWTLWKFASPPLDEIRNYFGEAIAFYFAFLSFYTWALVPPAIMGVLQTIISFDISRSYLFFGLFKMIWLTLFLEYWKRRSNELAYIWGTLRLVNIPKLHPTFRGKKMEIDPVTKQHVPVYPGYKRHLKIYCVSLPIVLLCLLFAVIVMLMYFQIEKKIMLEFDDGSLTGWILTQLPGVIYAISVLIMNIVYGKLATFLTEWENHKTQESFDNNRIVKLLLFEFVNNFVAMGYIAFYEQDLAMLKWQIAIMMVVNQLVNQFQEAVLPLCLQKCKRKVFSQSSRMQDILNQCDMWCYEGTYDDYLELFTQFGYVFLFSSIFPIAGILAILNNVIEIWSDGIKLCHYYQRPQARTVKGIGVWQLAFEVLGLIAVMSNCALYSMSPIIRSYAPDMSLSTWLLIAVSIEHIIIAVKMTLSYIISDVPKWVAVAIQKAQYKSLQALKVERKLKTKEMLKYMEIKNKKEE